MTDILLGKSSADLGKLLVLQAGYTPGSEAHDTAFAELGGGLRVVTGVVPRRFRFNVEINEPQIAGYLSLSDLYALWVNNDELLLVDPQGMAYPVIWQNAFDFQWSSKAAGYGVLAVDFLEKLV